MSRMILYFTASICFVAASVFGLVALHPCSFVAYRFCAAIFFGLSLVLFQFALREKKPHFLYSARDSEGREHILDVKDKALRLKDRSPFLDGGGKPLPAEVLEGWKRTIEAVCEYDLSRAPRDVTAAYARINMELSLRKSEEELLGGKSEAGK